MSIWDIDPSVYTPFAARFEELFKLTGTSMEIKQHQGSPHHTITILNKKRDRHLAWFEMIQLHSCCGIVVIARPGMQDWASEDVRIEIFRELIRLSEACAKRAFYGMILISKSEVQNPQLELLKKEGYKICDDFNNENSTRRVTLFSKLVK